MCQWLLYYMFDYMFVFLQSKRRFERDCKEADRAQHYFDKMDADINVTKADVEKVRIPCVHARVKRLILSQTLIFHDCFHPFLWVCVEDPSLKRGSGDGWWYNHGKLDFIKKWTCPPHTFYLTCSYLTLPSLYWKENTLFTGKSDHKQDFDSC